MRALLLAVLLVAPAAAARADDLLADVAAHDAAVEHEVHDALAAALLGDRDGVQAAVAAFAARDAARADAGRHPTGLTDDLRRLAAPLEPGRDARRAALEDVLDHDPDPTTERLTRHTLDTDDGARAAQLLADDAHNRRAGLVNDALRPFGVFTGGAFLAALSPFLIAGSAVDSVATTVGNLWHWNRLTGPQREALVRYRALLAREAGSPDARAAGREIRQLDTKRARALCDEALDLGTTALDAGDLDRARFHLADVADLRGCADRAAAPRERLARALAERDGAREAARWPADDPRQPTSDAEARAHADLLTAAAAGDADAMMASARRLLAVAPDGELAPGARYAVAGARDRAGHHEEARAALRDLAGDGSPSARLAAAALESPAFDRLDALGAAERQHTRDVARYVLFGGTDGRSAVYSAAQLGASGVQAAETLGVANVIGVATRAWSAWRKDPASNQEIIERGEELLARNPEAPDADDVHLRLADAYERAGGYERAIMHLRATKDPSERRLKRLEGELAEKLLADAKGSPAEPLLLDAIARHFPDTDAAATAKARLEDLPPPGDLRLDRDLLRAHPSLLGPDALDVEPTLLDGDPANGELAEHGCTLGPDGLRLALEAPDSDAPREETRPLTPEQLARARAAAEDVLYDKALHRDENDPDVGRWERYVPVFLQGSVGDSGLTVAPGIKMRRWQTDDPALYQ